jgi:hypothetical protein
LKPGSSSKLLIYPEPAVLRIWNVSKPKQLFVKIKFAPDTADDIGRHEWHAGGWQWNNERFLGLTSLLTQEKFVDVLKKQALVGTARKAFSRVRSYWESTEAQPITDAVHIKN